MDIITLAQELGTDYQTLSASIKNQFAELPDDSGNLRIAYIADIVLQGKTAPEEYCTERIRDIILNTRKHNLTVNLEESLLDEALKNNNFVIY
jgi:nitrate/nitrite-specific signal transduction histidine kinase